MEPPDRPTRIPRRTKITILVAVLVVFALIGAGGVELLTLPHGKCAGCGPIGTELAFAETANSTSGGVWSYNFTIEAVASDLALSSLMFEIKAPTGAFVTYENLCVAGRNGVALGTFSGGWASSGDSPACGPTAAHPPGGTVLTTQDSLIVYIGGNATGDSLTALFSSGTTSGPF